MVSAPAVDTAAATRPITAATSLTLIAPPSPGDARRRLSEDDRLPVASERLAVHRCGRSPGRERLDRVHQDRHEVLALPAGVGDPPELARDLGLVPRCLRRLEALHLLALERLVEPEVRDRRLVRLD